MHEWYEAILNKDTATLSQMLDSGYDPNVQDENGRTALMVAVIKKNIEIAKLLIQHGADLNKQDDIAELSALHFAVQSNSYELTKLLLENQAEVEIEDVNGNTPLSDAVFYSRGEGKIIKLLLAHGGDRNKENKHGVSPLSLAENIANYSLVKFFD